MNLPPNSPFWWTLGLSKSLTCGGSRGVLEMLLPTDSYLDSATPEIHPYIQQRQQAVSAVEIFVVEDV